MAGFMKSIPVVGAVKPEDMEEEELIALKPKPQAAMFINVESMKAQVCAQILNDQYRTEDLYSETGLWSYLAQHRWFETITLVFHHGQYRLDRNRHGQ